jgi:hypothetical protein
MMLQLLLFRYQSDVLGYVSGDVLEMLQAERQPFPRILLARGPRRYAFGKLYDFARDAAPDIPIMLAQIGTTKHTA